MFCVYLQDTPPKEDLLVTIVHNDTEYSFSRDLSLIHSPVLAELIFQNKDTVINFEYYHDFDDFQLICDLFNYKRVFITRSNIDYLSFAGDLLQISPLIKKTQKYKDQYTDFLKNPTFKEIESLRRQLFSIFKPSNFSIEENDYDYEDDDNENDNNNENESTTNNTNEVTSELKQNNNEQSNKSEEKETKTEHESQKIETESQKIENESQKTENESQKTENKSIKLSDGSDLPPFTYDSEYRTTVAHLLHSAFIFDPLNIENYIKLALRDHDLTISLINSIKSDSFSPSLTRFLFDLLKYQLKEIGDTELSKEITQCLIYDNNNYFEYDTNLRDYLNDFGNSLRNVHSILSSCEYLVNLVKQDDVDQLQTRLTSNPAVLNDHAVYSSLFKLSMMTSSTKSFKYLLLNYVPLFGSLVANKQMVQPSIIGGNIEIFRTMLDKYEGSPLDFIKDSILFHKTEILKWIIDNNCQFVSIYNTCCSKFLFGEDYVLQKWYKCKKCHIQIDYGCCKFCAKHCHVGEGHDCKFSYIFNSCFCDDDCELSKNIDLIGNKKIVEIDDLILLAVYCLNTSALKVLINEGAYLVRCRDRLTKDSYVLKDEKLSGLIQNLKGYKENSVEELNRKNSAFSTPFKLSLWV